MSFAADIDRIAKRMGEKTEVVAQATFVELFSSVVKDTPVLEGPLQGNWQATKDTPATGEVSRKGEKGPLAEIKTVVRKPGLYFLTNNKPYAAKIEFDGHSKDKAPSGMVRKNILRLDRILRKAAKR